MSVSRPHRIGQISWVLIGAVLVDESRRRPTLLVLSIGAVSHLLVDALLLKATGRSSPILGPPLASDIGTVPEHAAGTDDRDGRPRSTRLGRLALACATTGIGDLRASPGDRRDGHGRWQTHLPHWVEQLATLRADGLFQPLRARTTVVRRKTNPRPEREDRSALLT